MDYLRSKENRINIFYSLILFISNISLGINYGIYGPSLVDLAYLFGVSDNSSRTFDQSTDLIKTGNFTSDSEDLGSTSLVFTFLCAGSILGALCMLF
ncbi:hypothetical protein QR98_0051030 [Sarcoptes scabiei]|uniref:Uncharacterized protein n=1 Tax=Sarcoptes scabiei TaxID=52283 RepID=A0A132A6M5_SARSC|nr:hypothetical protein QR98_0051030 [Sarcoptes scabiei]